MWWLCYEKTNKKRHQRFTDYINSPIYTYAFSRPAKLGHPLLSVSRLYSLGRKRDEVSNQCGPASKLGVILNFNRTQACPLGMD